jgi:16S rRNA (guanine527-N7)-methyltransferase
MNLNEFIALILKFTVTSGISVSEEQAQSFGRHIELMLEWNRRLNLTRITAHEEIIIKHLLDSILPARFLPSSGRALDVGTGAGFPGIPLKILNPGLGMVLLDASRKKASFLTAASAAIGLRGIRARHGRWEEFAQESENEASFQLITMRAVRLESAHLQVLARHALAPGGVFAWWAGPEADEQSSGLLREKLSGLEMQGIEHYTLPGIDRERSIWLWRRT